LLALWQKTLDLFTSRYQRFYSPRATAVKS
jgi:hypothetical protein